ncbi:MAG: hypothetical protein WEC75_02105, partial [Dehalococcoidia bacterium]
AFRPRFRVVFDRAGLRGILSAMELRIAIEGDIVEREELLNGTQVLTLEGVSGDGAWRMSGALSWNIGLREAAEGDITLSRADGAELFGTLVGAEVRELAGVESGEGGHAMRLEYEIDGGSGAFEGAEGRASAEGELLAAAFRGVWSVSLKAG